jgi:DNA polymerase-3 subunit gamma/tau
MSQLVLARKYRPQNFAQMVGQDHVVQALTNALRTGRLHHAFMFTGTRGVGKTTVSRILAKSLNCLGPDGTGGITENPCGVCQACTDINRGRFVDYTELDAASNRGVDEVQSLLEQAVYKPVQGRFKVFMIDEVHMLTGHAFNAMLKTLEEPPEYLKFVLATTDPQKVPITVLSRCLQFNLRPMAPQTVLEHLEQVMRAEGLEAQTAALSLLAKGARGSMRDALSLLDQAIAYGGVSQEQHLTEAVVRQMVSAADTVQVATLLRCLAEHNGAALVAQCDQLRASGLSAGACLDELTALLQTIAVIQASGKTPHGAQDAIDADQAGVVVLAERLPADVVHLLYSLVLQGRGELALVPDEHDALMMILLRALVFMPGAVPGAPLVIERSSVERTPVAQTGAASVAQVQTPSVRQLVVRVPPEPSEKTERVKSPEDKVAGLGVPQMVVSNLGEEWFALVEQMVQKQLLNAFSKELALQSQWVARDSSLDAGAAQHWHLRVERESLSQSGHRERLEAALLTLGHQVQLSLEVGQVSDSYARRIAARRAESLATATQLIQSDPFVAQLENEFGGKLIPESIQIQPNN